MFDKITKFKVLFADLDQDNNPIWKEEPVKAATFGPFGITTVTIDTSTEEEPNTERIITIDGTSAFCRESTGKFDQDGKELFFGDIVEAEVKKTALSEESHIYVFPIYFINGAFVGSIDGIDDLIMLSEQNTREMKKLGNIYQHGSMLQQVFNQEVLDAMGEIEEDTKNEKELLRGVTEELPEETHKELSKYL